MFKGRTYLRHSIPHPQHAQEEIMKKHTWPIKVNLLFLPVARLRTLCTWPSNCISNTQKHAASKLWPCPRPHVALVNTYVRRTWCKAYNLSRSKRFFCGQNQTTSRSCTARRVRSTKKSSIKTKIKVCRPFIFGYKQAIYELRQLPHWIHPSTKKHYSGATFIYNVTPMSRQLPHGIHSPTNNTFPVSVTPMGRSVMKKQPRRNFFMTCVTGFASQTIASVFTAELYAIKLA